jgi:hypothetical protein
VRRKFCIPLKAKHNLPPFLELNPDVCSAIKENASSKLSTLSVKMMREYIHNVVFPNMIENELKDGMNEEIGQERSTLKTTLK